jgi:hypothetical protein
MGDYSAAEGGGKHYQALIVQDGKVAIYLDKDTGEPFQWPAQIAPRLKRQFSEDGWQVVESDGDLNFAVLGDLHRGWTVKNLAWLVSKFIEGKDGKVSVIRSRGE